jgi:D-amino-acid dehydrogenase
VNEQTCDVAVVGGGLVGTSLAYELLTLGADVVLVDGAHPGRASDAGAGILSPETTWNPDEHWFAFGMAAAAHYRTLLHRLETDGETDTGFSQCGLLMVAVDPAEDDWFATRAELAQRRAPHTLAEVTADDARELFPPLADVRRALHNPAAGRVDGRLMTAALGRAAERRGLRRFSATVTGLRVHHGAVTGVDTDEGALSCGAVAIAGGAWSQSFGEQLGCPIPVGPVKGQIVHMQLPVSGSADGVDSGQWPIVSPVFNHYLVAWPGGRVACGGTYEPAARFEAGATVAGLEELLRSCLHIAPGLAGAAVVDVRVGLRPVSGDDLPVLGPVPGWENVHLCTGHGTEGLLLGPYSARLVAQTMTGGPPAPEFVPYGVGRFGVRD